MSETDAPETDVPENGPAERDSPEETPAQADEFDADRARRKIAKANSEAENLRKRLKELEPLAQKARELEDASKSETERISGERDTYKTRAESAETGLTKLRIALEAAPEGASLEQVRAVAKRLTGSTDDELTQDAEELYTLLGANRPKPVASKPREALRGGGDPDEEPEETDPRKLAALIRG